MENFNVVKIKDMCKYTVAAKLAAEIRVIQYLLGQLAKEAVEANEFLKYHEKLKEMQNQYKRLFVLQERLRTEIKKGEEKK